MAKVSESKLITSNPKAPNSSALNLGMRLADRYVLGDIVGAGGGSTVRQGFDALLNRPVAVKTMHAAAVESADPAGRQRFLNEARSMARFDHPHVVRVFDAGEQDGALYLVMELIDGSTLAHVIADEAPIPTERAATIIDQVLSALSAVHDAGYVHRDVKPANVLVDRSGHVYLTDFGIAKQLDELEQSLTAIGTVVGTPAYLAPEQATGGPVGPTADVYAAGVLLAELIGARRPDGAITTSVIRDVAYARVIERATHHEAAERYQSASEMAAALRHARQTETAAIPVGLLPAMVTPPITVTQALPITAPRSDDPTSIMTTPLTDSAPLVDPVLGESERRRSSMPGAHDQERRRRWVLLTVVAGLVLVLLAVASSRRDNPFDDRPITPSTIPVELPAAPSTIPVSPSIAPVAVPAASVAPAPAAPPSDGRGGQGPQQGNDRGKPDKTPKP